jgi:hypothetical protein
VTVMFCLAVLFQRVSNRCVVFQSICFEPVLPPKGMPSHQGLCLSRTSYGSRAIGTLSYSPRPLQLKLCCYLPTPSIPRSSPNVSELYCRIFFPGFPTNTAQPLVCPIRPLLHDCFELAPQSLDRGKLVAHLNERSSQL